MAKWVGVGPAAGFLAMSAYFWHTEIASQRNTALLVTAISRARTHGCPWILGVDFQTSPETFEDMYRELLHDADAHIVATIDTTF